jgi:hypothetical protein
MGSRQEKARELVERLDKVRESILDDLPPNVLSLLFEHRRIAWDRELREIELEVAALGDDGNGP